MRSKIAMHMRVGAKGTLANSRSSDVVVRAACNIVLGTCQKRGAKTEPRKRLETAPFLYRRNAIKKRAFLDTWSLNQAEVSVTASDRSSA